MCDFVCWKYFDGHWEMLWDTRHDHFLLQFPGITNVFPRVRVTQITRYLHYCDEAVHLARAQDHGAKKFTNYGHWRCICVDVLWRSTLHIVKRLGIKQYHRDKPIKWGVKVWMLADSRLDITNFQVYLGRNEVVLFPFSDHYDYFQASAQKETEWHEVCSKKDGTTCFCVDYRKLNAITIKDTLPQIADIFDQLGGSTIFSTIDLKIGCWQIPMHPDNAHKMAFNCHGGLFQFWWMPFGFLKCARCFSQDHWSSVARFSGCMYLCLPWRHHSFQQKSQRTMPIICNWSLIAW